MTRMESQTQCGALDDQKEVAVASTIQWSIGGAGKTLGTD